MCKTCLPPQVVEWRPLSFAEKNLLKVELCFPCLLTHQLIHLSVVSADVLSMEKLYAPFPFPRFWSEKVLQGSPLLQVQRRFSVATSWHSAISDCDFCWELHCWELRHIYHHHPESKKEKSSEANSGSIHPYGRYGNAVKTRKAIYLP